MGVGGECVSVWGVGVEGPGSQYNADPNVALPELLFQHHQSNIFWFFRLSEFLPSQIHVTFNQRKSFPVVLTMLLMLMATNAIIIVIMLIKLLVIPTLIILTIMNSVK